MGAYVIVVIFFLLTYVFCDQPNVFTNYVFDHLGLGVGILLLVVGGLVDFGRSLGIDVKALGGH